VIEYAIALAGSRCKGVKQPTVEEATALLRRIGRFYSQVGKSTVDTPSAMGFVSQALFFNAQGDMDHWVEAAWKRFERHEAFLDEKLGFNIANAIFFARTILLMAYRKMVGTNLNNARLSKEQYYDVSYMVAPTAELVKAWDNAVKFSEEELSRQVPHEVRQRLHRYLERMSVKLAEIPPINSPLETNPLAERPLLRDGESYFAPLPAYLLKFLSLEIHNDLLSDPTYRGKYMQLKGPVLEEWAHELFRKMFPSDQIFRNIPYKHDGRDAEADIVIAWEDHLIFVECTTKWLKRDTLRGDLQAIRRDLDDSIRKCYNQLLRDKSAFDQGELKLKLKQLPSKFQFLIMTDTLYPNLLLDAAYGHYISNLVGGGVFPYVLSVFDLQFASETIGPEKFIEFIAERLEMYKMPNIFCTEESDYLKLFLNPQYSKLKELLASKKSTMNYIGPPTQKPPDQINPLYMIIDAIGSDRFVSIGFAGKYGNILVGSVMGFLYLVYNDWDAVIPHMVFSPEGFRNVVEASRKKGLKCREVAWVGMLDYLTNIRTPESRSLIERIQNGNLREDVNVLIGFPTDPKTKEVIRNFGTRATS
jgi:hypothetical protein